MDYLQSLVAIVTKYGRKKPDIIYFDGLSRDEEDEYEKAFGLLLEGGGRGQTDEAILGHLRNDAAKRQFKSRLGKKLLKMVLLTDVAGTAMSAALKAELECMKLSYLARMLTALYEREGGVTLAKKVHGEAEETGQALPMLAALTILRKQASETGKEKELNALQAQSTEWLKRLTAENRGQGYYEQVEVHFARSISQKPWLAKKALAWAARVKKDLKRFDSPVLNHERLMLLYAGHHGGKQYKKALADMDALHTYYQNHPEHASNTRYAEIALYKMDCYMHIPDHEAGKIYAETCLEYFWPGSRNWFFFIELYFVFVMQTGDYAKAGSIIVETAKEPGYADLDNIHNEKWRLYKAYYEYGSGTWAGKHSFTADRFFRDFISLIGDKSGYNAAIYIVAWCLQIRHGDEKKSSGSTDALKKYRTRYLHEGQDHRLNIYMNMMQVAERLSYIYQDVVDGTAELLEELRPRLWPNTRATLKA